MAAHRWFRWVAVIGTVTCLTLGLPFRAAGQTAGGGGGLSLEDLLNRTVSTASKYAQKSTEAPANITIITAEEIERYGFRNLAEALKTITSFSVATDHSYTYTGVRGFGRPADYNNRVLILLDGHTHNENVIGAGEIGSLRFLDVAEVDRVEVVRGPGSSLYGTRAMFAVVNVVTKRGADIDGGRAWSEVGNKGERMVGAQFGRRFDKGLDLTLSAGWGDSDGEDLYFPEYDTPETNNGLADGLNWGEFARGGASIGLGDFRAWGAIYERKKGTPTAPHGSVFDEPRARMEDNAWILDMQYEKDFTPSLAMTIRNYANHFETHHLYPHPGNLIEIRLDATWVGSEARLRWDVRPDHRLVLGAEYQWTPTAVWNMDDESGFARFDGNYPYSIGSLFLQDEYQVSNNLALTVGVRHDEYSSATRATTPRLALVYHPWEKSTLKVLWGKAFRAPNIYEVNFESPYASHLGNSDLRPEEIRSTELVWEQRLSKGLSAGLAFFRNDVANLIDQEPVTRPEEWVPSPAGIPFALQFQNGEDIRAQGLELELNAAFSSGILGYARYAYQRAEERASGTEAPNYPSHSLKVGGTGPLGAALNLGANFLWESNRKTLSGAETESYGVLDLTAVSEPILNRFTLSVSAKNLLDTAFSLPSGPQHALISIPQPGRQLLFRVSAEW